MPLFTFGVQLCWSHDCSTCQISALLPKDPVAAEQWLADLSRDPLAMLSLRQVAAECNHDRLTQFTNQDVIRTVAREITSGALRACDQNWATHPFVASSAAPAADDAATDSFKAFPIDERKTQSAASAAGPAATDSPTFPENLDVPAQALALASAAAQGVPFCPE